ncbi:MAG: HAMP domain-containing sensor histidine kinase [Nitratireductor sp.]
MQRLRTILAITAVRLSIAYSLIFGLVAVIIVMYLTGSTVNIIRRQIQDSINTEVADLATVYERGGINGLMRTLERNAASPGANIYVVADPAGTIIAANILEIESGILNHEGWAGHPFDYTRHQDNGARTWQAMARVVELPNGMRLLVGRDLGDPERFRQVVGRALFLALAAMLALGVATWLVVGRRALKRLDLVSKSTARILAGDHSERLPLSGGGDEFDRLSARLNGMLDRINLLDDGLKQVSDNIAHDLKTPLTRLRNKADAALGEASNVDEMRNALGEVIADTDQIIKTFNALLMISRVESGSAVTGLSPIDITSVVKDVAELYLPVAEDDGFETRVDVEDGLLVTGSRELLAQALSNLVENAIKYGRDPSRKPLLAISARKKANQISICITDNGPGIAEADRERVTERFTRLEKSRTLPGNGLGLSLVRAVAVLHQGSLELSDAKPGLAACIHLPAEGSIA